MTEEELMRHNLILESHRNLPVDLDTCYTYGLSGNCGELCPLFQNKECEVYDDVKQRIKGSDKE